MRVGEGRHVDVHNLGSLATLRQRAVPMGNGMSLGTLFPKNVSVTAIAVI